MNVSLFCFLYTQKSNDRPPKRAPATTAANESCPMKSAEVAPLDEPLPLCGEPVAWTEPGAPEESVTAAEAFADGGGFVWLLFVSMYASLSGLFKHVTTGWMLNFGELSGLLGHVVL